jgi:hypothetical protein
MSLTVERAAEATPEVHDLIGELNAVLGAVYETHQRHGLAIEQLFEPNVRFFVARFVVGCGHRQRAPTPARCPLVCRRTHPQQTFSPNSAIVVYAIPSTSEMIAAPSIAFRSVLQ